MFSIKMMFRALVCCLAVLAGPVGSWAAEPEPAAQELSAPKVSDYRLGPDDKIRVIVFGEEALSGEFNITSAGKMSLPLVGEVQAGGLTINQLQEEIQHAYQDGYLKNPRVSAEVLTFRPFFILGEVGKPGQYPYTSGLTVLRAVATAGGFTYRANKGKVYIKRGTDAQEQVYPLTSSTPVAPGDTIRIGERLF